MNLDDVFRYYFGFYFVVLIKNGEGEGFMRGKAIFLIPIVSLLVIAFVYPLPYGFYTLNRIITTLFSAIGAMQTWGEKPLLSYFLIAIAILFNPFIPIHLTRDLWQIIDAIATIPFVVLIFSKY